MVEFIYVSIVVNSNLFSLFKELNELREEIEELEP
jgi:hypothetical protein